MIEIESIKIELCQAKGNFVGEAKLVDRAGEVIILPLNLATGYKIITVLKNLIKETA
ncbi:MAG: hypothetical protein IMF19_05690 [Proteobacteria bacterium]|nr:hypothetical protein [Pseudomonadota bacterium]